MFYYRLYRSSGYTVLAACDGELLGNVYREGDVVLDVSRSYYGGNTCDAETLKGLINDSDIISLVGEGAISLAVDLGLAEWRFVKRVSGVPHLNIYRI